VILPVVLYGCPTWSLIWREEHRLWLLKDRVPRNMYGPSAEDVRRKWSNFQNEELQDLSQNFPE